MLQLFWLAPEKAGGQSKLLLTSKLFRLKEVSEVFVSLHTNLL